MKEISISNCINYILIRRKEVLVEGFKQSIDAALFGELEINGQDFLFEDIRLSFNNNSYSAYINVGGRHDITEMVDFKRLENYLRSSSFSKFLYDNSDFKPTFGNEYMMCELYSCILR